MTKRTLAKKATWHRYVWATGLVLATAVVCLSFMLRHPNGGGVVGTVNGAPIYAQELALYADAHRAAVAWQFSMKHNLPETGSSFWTNSYDGEVPIDNLLELAFTDAVRAKVIQQEAVRHNIVAPVDFMELKKAAEEENKSRSAGGVAASGMEQYALAQYLSFQMSRTEDELMDALLQNELHPTEEQLRQAFDSIDPAMLEKPCSITGKRFFWGKEDEAKKPVEQLALLLSQGVSADSLTMALAESLPTLQCEDFIMVSGEVHREDVTGLQLMDLLLSAETGELVPFTLGAAPCAYLVEKRTGGGRLTIEEAPRFAETAWLTDQFAVYIDNLISTAEVKRNKNAGQLFQRSYLTA